MLYQAVNESYYHLVMNELSQVEKSLEGATAEARMLYELLGEKPREALRQARDDRPRWAAKGVRGDSGRAEAEIRYRRFKAGRGA